MTIWPKGGRRAEQPHRVAGKRIRSWPHESRLMRHKNVAWIWLCFSLFLPATNGCAGANVAQRGERGQTVATARFSFSGWSADYVALVRETTSSELPVRKIAFFAQGQASPQFEYKTADGFLGFWPDNGEWCGTLWSTGSAMVLRIFGPTPSGIGLLLEKGLQLPPEVVDLDGDGKNELILTSGRFSVTNGRTDEEPSSCLVFKWSASDHRFDQVRVVPWSKRQDFFGKLIK